MRAFNVQQVARPTPPDRNPTTVGNSAVNGGVGPAGSTQRWSFTVPAGKRVQVMHLLCKLFRDAAATTPGQDQLWIQYVPNGGSTIYILFSFFSSNTIGAGESQYMGPQQTLSPGDVISAWSSDASTGGTTELAAAWSGIQYDL